MVFSLLRGYQETGAVRFVDPHPRLTFCESILRRYSYGFICGIVLIANSGCQSLSNYSTEPAIPHTEGDIELTSDEVSESAKWWYHFNDPTLNELVETTLASNRELAVAVDRLNQVQASLDLVGYQSLPTIQPALDVSTSDTPTNAGIGNQFDAFGINTERFASLGVAIPDRLALTTHDVSGRFSYELDFFGRKALATRIAMHHHAAAEAEMYLVSTIVIAETIGTYIEIAALRDQFHLAVERRTLLNELEQSNRKRYARGLLDVENLYRVQMHRRQAESRVPIIESRIADAEGRLATLVGGPWQTVENLVRADMQPRFLDSATPTKVPVDLLSQRPDVQRARNQYLAALLDLDRQIRDRLPRLKLVGSIGLQSANVQDWFDPHQWFQSVSMQVLGPFIQGRHHSANVELALHRFQESLNQYSHAQIQAVNEVEAVFRQLQSHKQRLELMQAAYKESKNEAEVRKQQYRAGISSFHQWLQAEESRNSTESLLVESLRDLAFMRLALHRALGGQWARPEVYGVDS